MRHWRAATAVAALAVVLSATQAACRPGQDAISTESPSNRPPGAVVVSTGSPRHAPAGTAPTRATGQVLGAGQARAALSHLAVVPRRPYIPGYQRSCSPGDKCSFGPAWTDDNNTPNGHDGCDTRNQVLADQFTQLRFRAGSKCVVEAGRLRDPYTGADVEFTKASAQLAPVDHMVPLALAWDLGAAQWSQQSSESTTPTTAGWCSWWSTSALTRPRATAAQGSGCQRTVRTGAPTTSGS
jgi:hypothetical protein